MSYIEVTSALVLHADPVESNHAATKRYVDGKKSAVTAQSFTTGIIPVGRMAALSGDITSAQGSGVAVLADSGITAGTYPKVTIDSAGRVTTGTTLSSNDIPSVPFSKVTTGKPTTAAGYSINNLVPLSGGTVTGPITSTATPSANLDAVTKGYVDSALTGIVSGTLAVGDIVRKPVAVAPSGFLRCNGGEVSKTTYAGLYAIVGDKFSLGVTQAGAGQPWRQQYDINTEQSTDISSWTTSTSLPGTVGHSQAIVTKNRVYLLGGYVNSSYSSTVYTAPINLDGTLGAWTTGTSLPGTVHASQAIVTKNRVYLLGGLVNGSYSSTVYTAPINLDGTLGAWTTGTSLPDTVGFSQAIVTKNRVYLLGGVVNSSYSSTVYTAPINLDGTLGAWTTPTSLPDILIFSQAIVTKNRVYLLGGYSNSSASSTVYTAPINLDGTLGAWTTGTSLPDTVGYSQVIVTKNRVYLLGGYVNSSYSSTVYTAPINLDGTLGAWTTSTPLPGTVIYSQAIVTKQRVYLLGGYSNSSYSSTVYTAPISGGLNDYSPYYDGTIVPLSPTQFKLPDFTTAETSGVNYYIKY